MKASDEKFLSTLNDRLWPPPPPKETLSPARAAFARALKKLPHKKKAAPIRGDVQLTPKQLARLYEVLDRNADELIFDPCGGIFGFGVGVNVYAPPVYPGLPCEPVISIVSQHFKGDNANERDQSYSFVSKYVYTKRNKELRAMFGFKAPLQSIGHYDY